MENKGPASIVRELRAATGLPIVLMALLSAALFIQVRHLLDLSAWADRTDRVIARAHELLQLFVDEESGLRGYLVTGEESFLEPYNRALAAVPAVQERLESLLADNPNQRQRLKTALDLQGKWSLLARRLIIDRKTSPGPYGVEGDLGKRDMDGTRRHFAALIRQEEEQRDRRAESVNKAVRGMILASAGLIGAIVFILAFLTRRQLNRVGREYNAAFEDVHKLNVELEQRINERNQLLESERAARAEANRAGSIKEEFVATLSHELRTPLNSILGWTQLLRSSKSPSEDDIRHGLEVIERNTQMQTRLIGDLLDMSRILSGKMRLDVQPVNLATVVQAAIDSVLPGAEAKNIRLHQVLDPRAGPVRGDPGRLQQVVWNLLSNAIKFTPRDGKVEVVLERVNSHVEITVSDTGQGIATDFIDHVFERFRQADASTTRAHSGLGLGLAIARHLTELHGGTIRVSSPGEGKGTTFTVLLPLTVVQPGRVYAEMEHPTSPAHTLGEVHMVSLQGIRVLVIDDEADARDLIERVLLDCHAEATTAGSAEEALTLLPQFHPHVIVSDIGMPGMDGYEMLRQIRALSADEGGTIPAVALTAFARSEDRRRALVAGYQMHVAKPVEPAELVAVVASLASRRATA